MNQHARAPEFAMSFTQEAVLLERHDGHGWTSLGEARFAGRDMAARLNALRGEAGGVAGAADTVLVIPDDQILYTTLTVPVGSDIAGAVARALEGMTPYAAADLAFDWCPSETGDIETLRVAAVARRTLEEAEDFARAQGFRPSGFTARPGDERFDGQPDFGAGKDIAEDQPRMPFSEPDLTQARITAPVIDDAFDAPSPVAQPQNPAVISRITPHHVVERHRPAPAVDATAPTEAPALTVSDIGPANAVSGEAKPAAPTPPVIRHGGSGTAAAPRLSPRAAAVRERAADARARRPEAEPAAEDPRTALVARLRQLDPARLPVMMGILVVALVAVLLLFGGDPEPARISDGAAAPQPVAEAPQSQPPAAETADAAAEPTAQDIAATVDPEPVAPVVEEVAPETAPVETAAVETVPTDSTRPETEIEAPLETAEAPPAAPEQNAAVSQPENQAVSDPLTRALREAMGENGTDGRVVDPQAAETASAGDAPRVQASTAPSASAAARAAAAANSLRLSRSARPSSAPARTAAPAAPDALPSVPANPLPFEQRTEREPSRVTGIRPPERPAARATAPAAPASAVPAAATPRPATPQPLGGSSRPRARPDSLTHLEQGSASEDTAPTRLTRAETLFLQGLLRDLRTAQAGASGLSQDESRVLIRLADARPLRKPVSVAGPSENAVRAAVAEAVAASDRPASRGEAELAAAAPAPSATSARTSLSRSVRPLARPGGRRAASDSGPGNASLSGKAVEDAIAAAVANSTALPGAVALTALTTSAIPPRRSGSVAAAASSLAPSTRNAAPTADDLRAAAAAQERDAAMAEQRRIDAELQAQAEARARARAAADAQAEARARAQAEARARAQAEAEARAAASRKRSYTPPEAEQEPDVAASVAVGRAQGSAAASATVKDGITLSRTQIIGTIGAGKASRALVRLSNGRVLTLRLGDRINGGTITDIGNSRITYVKGGRPQQLSVLNGQ